MITNKISKAGALIAGALLASQAAQASITSNDVYLGFQNSTASDDYIVDLGSLSSIVNQASVVDLSADFSLSDFDSVLGSSGTTYAAAVGASSSVADAFGTVLRTSNIGDSALAGSTGPMGNFNASEDATTYASVSTVIGPAAGTGNLDSTKSWSTAVSPTQVTGNYYSASGLNPNSVITGSSVLYEDLYMTTDTSGGGRGDAGNPWVYEGYFTVDFTGSSPDVTFTGVGVTAAPEPSTWGIFVVSGILFLALRRRFSGSAA